MKLSRLHAKIRKLHEDHEDEEMESGELNLVPYLDIVTNVLMFLLATTSMSLALADINVSSPTVSRGPSEAPTTEQPKQDLNLTCSISEKGFTIAASGAVLYENDVPGRIPTIPKINGQYDYAALTKKMRQIKDSVAAEENKVIINANPDITYELVVNAMDAIRTDGTKTLFPDVLLAAGVN